MRADKNENFSYLFKSYNFLCKGKLFLLYVKILILHRLYNLYFIHSWCCLDTKQKPWDTFLLLDLIEWDKKLYVQSMTYCQLSPPLNKCQNNSREKKKYCKPWRKWSEIIEMFKIQQSNCCIFKTYYRLCGFLRLHIA